MDRINWEKIIPQWNSYKIGDKVLWKSEKICIGVEIEPRKLYTMINSDIQSSACLDVK